MASPWKAMCRLTICILIKGLIARDPRRLSGKIERGRRLGRVRGKAGLRVRHQTSEIRILAIIPLELTSQRICHHLTAWLIAPLWSSDFDVAVGRPAR